MNKIKKILNNNDIKSSAIKLAIKYQNHDIKNQAEKIALEIDKKVKKYCPIKI